MHLGKWQSAFLGDLGGTVSSLMVPPTPLVFPFSYELDALATFQGDKMC